MWLILVLMFFLDYYLEACQGCNLVCSKITTRMEEMDHWENGCNIQWLTVDSVLIFCRWDEGKKERIAYSGSEAEEKETRLNENEKKSSEEILKCSQSTRGRIISFDLHTKNSRRRGNAEQVYHSAESAQIKGLLVILCYKTTVLHLGWSCPWTQINVTCELILHPAFLLNLHRCSPRQQSVHADSLAYEHSHGQE